MDKIKIGVFGAGRGFALCKGVMLYPEAELVAACDAYEPLLEKLKEAGKEVNLDIACYTDFDEFIKHDMDAVILANYATEHAPYAIRCMEAGMHVMSELMPCETMAQAVELVEAVERTGKVYAYAENCCYMKEPFEMWKRMKKGELGDIRFAYGEYVHDCSIGWPELTRGDKNHWRNRMYPTFYATHSLGPIMMMSGHRPVQVTGFETPGHTRSYIPGGVVGGGRAGIEMVILDNGAVLESIHGGLKREPHGNNWQVYCDKGFMMSNFLDEDAAFYCYKEHDDEFCLGDWEKFIPDQGIRPELASQITTHGGADFYSTYFFIQKILGNPDGAWSIDIYQALDMAFCGIMAHRSLLNGNRPERIPNFRNPEEREAYRNDRQCVTPAVAGDQLLPQYKLSATEVPDEVFDRIKDLFAKGLNGNGDEHYDVWVKDMKLKKDFYTQIGFPKCAEEESES